MKTHRQLRNLHEAYVYATEVQLESLAELVRLATVDSSRMARQRSTCLGMLRWCASALVDHACVDWGPPRARRFPQVSAILACPCLESALDRSVAHWRRAGASHLPARPELPPRLGRLALAAAQESAR